MYTVCNYVYVIYKSTNFFIEARHRSENKIILYYMMLSLCLSQGAAVFRNYKFGYKY